MSLQLKDAEIKSILAEVKSSLQAAKKAEVEKLAKAVDGEESSPAGKESSSASAESSPTPPEASESSPASAPEMSESSASASAPSMESAPPAPDAVEPSPEGTHPEPHEDPTAPEAPADPAALCAEYAKLDDEALKSHYIACKQAVFERMQGAPSAPGPADGMAPPAPGMDAGMDAMKGESSAAGTAPNGNVDPVTADKSEAGLNKLKGAMRKEEAGTAPKGNVDPVTPTGSQNLNGPAAAKNGPGADLSNKQVPKSQPQLDNTPKGEVAKSEKSSEVQVLEAQIEGLAKAVTLLMNPPTTIRKAVTSIAMLDRAENLNKAEKKAKAELTPAEMKSKLSDMIRSNTLSKAEKQAVVDYTLTKNQVHLEKIAHLFE